MDMGLNRKQRRAQGKTVSTPQSSSSSNLKLILEAGIRHHQAGQLAEAERFYRQVLAADAQHADALHLLGVIAYQVGQNGIAVEIISNAIKINPTVAIYHSNLGNALKNLGRLDESVAACNNAIRIKADYAEAHSNLGNALQALGRLDDAVAAYNNAIRLKPDDAEAHSNLGSALQGLGRFDDAVAACNNAIRFKPDFAVAHYNRAKALKALGCLDEAVAAYNNAIRFKPDLAEAHSNLGSALKELGRLDEAVVAYNTAIRFKPDYAEVYSNLGNALQELGRFDDALAACNNAIRLKPDFAEAHTNLGNTLQKLARLGAAVDAYNTAIRFKPDVAETYSNLGAALKELGRLDEAVSAYDTAIRLKADFTEAHANRGIALHELGRFDEALASYERAASLPGTAAEQALVHRAILFMEHGQAAQAEAAFTHAVKVFPRSAAAWFNRADFTRFTAGDPAIAAMQALLASSAAPSQSDQMLLHFALGKAFLDIGESDHAFAHLDQGNRMKRALIAYDADATSRYMEGIAAVFTPALLERLAGQGATSSRPIFVLGMPRSGTTLVEQILASHPEIHAAGEMSHIQNLVDRMGDFPAAIATIALEPLGDAYLKAIEPLGQGRRHVVDKMLANFPYAGLIRLILPEARIIHCRRDPVDTCLSCYSKLFAKEMVFSYDQAELGRFHRDYQTLTAHWRAVLPATHFLEIDYEAVVADLESEARRMLDFLGLPWNPACLEFHRTDRPVRTASVNQVRKPIYRSSAGRWRQHAQNLRPLLDALAIEPA
jgi:tetratricopeptide (TPR) repeat protein